MSWTNSSEERPGTPRGCILATCVTLGIVEFFSLLTCWEFLNSTIKNASVSLQTYKHLRAKSVYTEKRQKGFYVGHGSYYV